MTMMRLRREDPRVVGAFRLHRRLGAGGMGVVYLGSDRRGQRVALKVIRPELAEDQEFRSRFAREVSAARRIRGGCTARLVAADLEADRPWFATQYVPGPSLHDRVAQEGPLPAAETAAIGAALAEGLVAVHEAGVVHRDLKPSNILLSPKGPRIIDFGIAWATGASTLTHVGTAVGSPGFLAPEQVRGQAVTPATDVFSLGATLAYAALGDSPFGQGSSEVMLYRVVHEEAQLRGVPAALAPLLRSCLAKSPRERPTTLQLSLRLKEIAARETRGAPQVAPRRRLPGTTAPRPGPPRAAAGRASDSRRHGPATARPVSGAGRGPRRGPARGPGSGPGRGLDPRLLRQRLVIFVTVTLLVALGIAVVQGCQGPV
ncbi:serine/threonine-protein kinase [Streptomyces sp. 4N509B]|uniref:serine/threonine-protein kinase n=1 Tax=Streptomyces sp. 4N509B TaxID=3457413 RepID=UPI003FD10B54